MVIFSFQGQEIVDFKFLLPKGLEKNLKNPKRPLFMFKSLVLSALANINVVATATLHSMKTCNLSFSSSHEAFRCEQDASVLLSRRKLQRQEDN